MTPAEFCAALEALGWSQRHLAGLLRCDTNLPTRWATGRAAVPPALADWLGKLAAYHRRQPVPEWRSKSPHK